MTGQSTVRGEGVPIRAAAVQLNSTEDKARNLEAAEALVREAAADGADLVALPEKWNLLGSDGAVAAGAESLEGGTSIEAARGWARELGVNLLAGSIGERVEGEERIFNTSVLIDREGETVAVYRKIHLFDVDVGGIAYRESEGKQPGDEPVTGPVDGLEVGLTVCYDLRFCELYRVLALRGALAFTVPAAFTLHTGRDHWEVLLRARAIENQAFVVAPNQVGEAPPQYRSFGRSMLVDPWGVVVAQAPDRECFIAADLDLEHLHGVRASLPALAHRRPEAYAWPERTGA